MKKYLIALLLLPTALFAKDSHAWDVYRNHPNDQLIETFRSTIRSYSKDLQIIKKKIKHAEERCDTVRLQKLFYKSYVIRQQITWNTLQLAYAIHGDYFLNKRYSEMELDPIFMQQ